MHLFVSFLFVLGRAPLLSPLTPSTELIFFFLNDYVETYCVEIRQPHPMFKQRPKTIRRAFFASWVIVLETGYRVSLTPLHLTCFV